MLVVVQRLQLYWVTESMPQNLSFKPLTKIYQCFISPTGDKFNWIKAEKGELVLMAF